jgi:signal transduction histidine kinase
MTSVTEIRKAGTIMVVDDDPDILNVVCLLLRENAYTTIPCRSGAGALEKLLHASVDVVLTDIKMPDGLSGIDLLDQLHILYPEVPVILMTAYADLNTAIDAIKKGAFDFIQKPYKQEQLIYSVEKALKYKILTEMEKDYRKILEEFNREIETLISERTMNLMALTVADKVRNPATVIGGLCRQMMASGDVPDKFAGYLTDINEEAGKLEKIVTDFQALLKSRESLFTHENLNEVVSGVISVIEKELHRKEVVFGLSLSEQPLKINMQRNLLGIAIFHLLRNAMEATRKGDMISVSTAQESGLAVLRIADTGSGIAEEILDRIFEPFFSTKLHSFGMGLPLVKQIVTEHLGKIEVESDIGKGTSFSLKFPMRWKQDTADRDNYLQSQQEKD